MCMSCSHVWMVSKDKFQWDMVLKCSHISSNTTMSKEMMRMRTAKNSSSIYVYMKLCITIYAYFGREKERSHYHFQCLYWCLLFRDFRSTTIIEMLSSLYSASAQQRRLSAAEWAGGSELSLSRAFLRSSLSELRATFTTCSLDRTSHKPSLAKIRHSSSSLLVVKVTSGSEIIHGFR